MISSINPLLKLRLTIASMKSFRKGSQILMAGMNNGPTLAWSTSSPNKQAGLVEQSAKMDGACMKDSSRMMICMELSESSIFGSGVTFVSGFDFNLVLSSGLSLAKGKSLITDEGKALMTNEADESMTEEGKAFMDISAPLSSPVGFIVVPKD